MDRLPNHARAVPERRHGSDLIVHPQSSGGQEFQYLRVFARDRAASPGSWSFAGDDLLGRKIDLRGQFPTRTTVPPFRTRRIASSTVSDNPTASKETSAPPPPVQSGRPPRAGRRQVRQARLAPAFSAMTMRFFININRRHLEYAGERRSLMRKSPMVRRP